jgi:hypothetical protein
MTVEPTRSQDGGVDHLGMVAGSDDDHTLPAFDTVEFAPGGH